MILTLDDPAGAFPELLSPPNQSKQLLSEEFAPLLLEEPDADLQLSTIIPQPAAGLAHTFLLLESCREAFKGHDYSACCRAAL